MYKDIPKPEVLDVFIDKVLDCLCHTNGFTSDIWVRSISVVVLCLMTITIALG